MIVYSNLTQNLTGDRFVYLRSTDVEQMNWERLLWSVPDEMLYFLSLGLDIMIQDITTDPKGGKIKTIFCPVFADILRKLYFGKSIEHKNLVNHFEKAWDVLLTSKLLYTKYHFWKGKIPETFKIIGEGILVPKEANLIHEKRTKIWKRIGSEIKNLFIPL